MRALKQQAVSKIAVILNANAKKVTPRVRAQLEKQCDGIDVYYSRSLDEARSICRQILELGYSTVLTGGGDGTIVQTINNLYQMSGRIAQQSSRREVRHLQALPSPKDDLPAIGVLKLGTGNALASVVGAGRHYQDAARIRTLMEEGVEPSTLELPLIEANGEVFPFAGLGWDAMILNDYNELKDSASNAATRWLYKSVAGYLIAAFARSAPRIAFGRAPEVEIRTLESAIRLGPKGEAAQEFEPNSIIYRGPVNLLSFATMPYYGFEFKLFPFTEGLKDRFQIRLSTVSVPEAIGHLPSIWKGNYRAPSLIDFHASRVTMKFSQPVPYQVGGDARGERDSLTVSASSYPIELVNYRTQLQAAPLRSERLALA